MTIVEEITAVPSSAARGREANKRERSTPSEIESQRRRDSRSRMARLAAIASVVAGGFSSVASADGIDTYRVDIYGEVYSHDYDSLSSNEHCSEAFDVIVAVVSEDPNQQEQTSDVEFATCGDQVQPLITLTTVRRSDASVHITGQLKMWSQYCYWIGDADFTTTCDPDGVFVISEIDLVLYPGDPPVDVSATGHHENTVEFKNTKISLLKQNF